jgi:YesN/AraC family two-component response regulator
MLGPCKNGVEVLELLRRTPVDAVLTDVKMQPCDGIKLAQTVQRESPHVYILFLTAFSEFEYAHAAVEYGVWKYILKPIRMEELLEALRTLRQVFLQERYNVEGAVYEGETTDPFVQRIDEYVACHFNRASLQEVAELMDVSPEYVSRNYYIRSGRHFSHTVQRIRMTQAVRLLTNTRYRVAEIAGIIGYRNPKNFTRRFKKHFGVTPREYRLKNAPSLIEEPTNSYT